MTNKLYRIVASCDPYNARFHYRDQEVIRYDMATPIEWVHDDNYGYGYTLEEAFDILDGYACDLGDNVCYEDDASIEDLRAQFLEDTGEELDTSWFKGSGWYEDNCQVYAHGDMFLRDDTMTYSVEPII